MWLLTDSFDNIEHDVKAINIFRGLTGFKYIHQFLKKRRLHQDIRKESKLRRVSGQFLEKNNKNDYSSTKKKKKTVLKALQTTTRLNAIRRKSSESKKSFPDKSMLRANKIMVLH